MKPRVLITRVLPESALEVVRQGCEVQLDPLDQPLTPAALRQAVVGKQGVLCLVTDRLDAQVLEAATELKVVSNVAVGCGSGNTTWYPGDEYARGSDGIHG